MGKPMNRLFATLLFLALAALTGHASVAQAPRAFDTTLHSVT
jgi:hypothetical protein